MPKKLLLYLKHSIKIKYLLKKPAKGGKPPIENKLIHKKKKYKKSDSKRLVKSVKYFICIK